MNVYSIHTNEPTVGETVRPKLVLVKDGFSWAAALFGPLWAIVLGLWETAALILVVQIALGLVISTAIAGSDAQGAAQIGVAVCTGIVAGELRRWNLSRRGLVERASVLGLDEFDAERRFLEDHPEMVRALHSAPAPLTASVGEA